MEKIRTLSCFRKFDIQLPESSEEIFLIRIEAERCCACQADYFADPRLGCCVVLYNFAMSYRCLSKQFIQLAEQCRASEMKLLMLSNFLNGEIFDSSEEGFGITWITSLSVIILSSICRVGSPPYRGLVYDRLQRQVAALQVNIYIESKLPNCCSDSFTAGSA